MALQITRQIPRVPGIADDPALRAVSFLVLFRQQHVASFGLRVVDWRVVVEFGGLGGGVECHAVGGREGRGEAGCPGYADAAGRGGRGCALQDRRQEEREEVGSQAVGSHLQFVGLRCLGAGWGHLWSGGGLVWLVGGMARDGLW